MNHIKNVVYFLLILTLTACNLPTENTTTTTSNTVTIESKITSAWEDCVNNAGVFTHVCTHTSLSALAEVTPVEPGFAVPAGTLILVNQREPFVVNGNQPGTRGTDYVLIAGAQTGLSSTYLTLQNVTMRVAGKQIVLQNANPSSLFPGWGTWPPVLPTPFVIQTPGQVDPTSTPNIIPPAFSSADFLGIWYSQTPETKLVNLLDEAYAKWGMYGGEFTTTTYSFVRAGSIIWSVEPSNIVDLSKQPFELYDQSCFSTFNEAETVIYAVCDMYVVNPPFKYLTVSDWQNFPLGSIPALPGDIHP